MFKFPVGSIVKVNPKISYLAQHMGIIHKHHLAMYGSHSSNFIHIISTEGTSYAHIDESAGPYADEHLILITHADDVTTFEKIMYGVLDVKV